MTPAEILTKAADVIETRGWQQGALVDPWGGTAVCAQGAINVAAGYPAEVAEAPFEDRVVEATYLAFERWLSEHHGDASIHRWNDAEGRTKDEVTAALREAARTAGSAS